MSVICCLQSQEDPRNILFAGDGRMVCDLKRLGPDNHEKWLMIETETIKVAIGQVGSALGKYIITPGMRELVGFKKSTLTIRDIRDRIKESMLKEGYVRNPEYGSPYYDESFVVCISNKYLQIPSCVWRLDTSLTPAVVFPGTPVALGSGGDIALGAMWGAMRVGEKSKRNGAGPEEILRIGVEAACHFIPSCGNDGKPARVHSLGWSQSG
jgi:hypothetical protein